MNTFVSPCVFALRFDANTSFFPSGENIGNPSNVSLKVIRSKPVPSDIDLVKIEIPAPVGSSMFDAKIIRLPSGKKYGPKFALPLLVTWRLFDPSAFITQISSVVGRIRFCFSRFGVIGFLLIRLRMISAIDDLLAVVRPEWTTIVTEFVRQPAHVLAVGVHRVDVEIAVTHRSENEFLAVERDRCFRVVAGRVGQLFRI